MCATSPPPGTYIHGSQPDEQARLSALNDVINQRCLRALSLTGALRILDVGSGLGQFSRLMASASRSHVLGIERDAAQRSRAQELTLQAGDAENVEFRAGDALNLPLTPEERGSFDLAHTRFLLEHVPDPQAVVNQMVQALRPGGRLILADDDHAVLRLWPEPAGVMDVWSAYLQTYTCIGCDPFIGRRLVELIANAGAQPVRNDWIFFGACAGDPAFPVLAENMARILHGAKAHMAALNLLAPARVDDACAALRQWANRPDAALWYSICLAEGRRV